MWIFLNDAIISIVEYQDGFPAGDRRNRLLVRARAPNDIRNVFPSAVTEHTPGADYAYRAVLRRSEVGKVLAARLYRLNYSNYKDSVVDQSRHNVLLRIWGALAGFFRSRECASSKWPHAADRRLSGGRYARDLGNVKVPNHPRYEDRR